VAKEPDEWFKQADYDIQTAQVMLDAGRHFYAVFMAHLSIEKALKGLYLDRLAELPPKTHSLLFLSEKAQLDLPDDLSEHAFILNRASVLTRYPEELATLEDEFPEPKTREILEKSKEMLTWLKAQGRKP